MKDSNLGWKLYLKNDKVWGTKFPMFKMKGKNCNDYEPLEKSSHLWKPIKMQIFENVIKSQKAIYILRNKS